MPDSSWIAYVGAVTGTIGSLTGIGALWVAIQANKKSVSAKASDLRIALGKAIHEAENDFAVMRVFIREVDISRRNVAALEGGFDPKSTEFWNRNVELFEKIAKQSKETFFKQLKELNSKSISELEKEIIDTHMSKTNLKAVETIFINAKKRYDETLKRAQ